MPNYVEEPPSLKERFDHSDKLIQDHAKAILQRLVEFRDETDKRLEGLRASIPFAAKGHLDPLKDGLKEHFEAIDADMKVLKKAVGCILLGLAGQPVNIGSDLLESLGFKTSSIVPASAIVKPS